MYVSDVMHHTVYVVHSYGGAAGDSAAVLPRAVLPSASTRGRRAALFLQ
jgi:hypothetical protein